MQDYTYISTIIQGNLVIDGPVACPVTQAGIRTSNPIANKYLPLVNILRPLMNKD